MNIWQADFYYLPSLPGQDKEWELTICVDSIPNPRQNGSIHTARCSTQNANASWLQQQISDAAKGNLPDRIKVFRPQALGLLTAAATNLGIEVEATRNTDVLKQLLVQKYQNNLNYNPLALDKPPPQALPEDLWGDEWQIANIAAGQIVDLFSDRPIPICRIPTEFQPINMGIPSSVFIPGVVVYGGRTSMQLAGWIDKQIPAFINYIPTEVGKSGGFILETGLVDRWIFNTFESEKAAQIAKDYEQKKQASKGLHFLLIQPDDSGMTTTAFWLLRQI